MLTVDPAGRVVPVLNPTPTNFVSENGNAGYVPPPVAPVTQTANFTGNTVPSAQLPQNQTMGAYHTTAQNENALVARSGRVGDVTALLHAARLNYARQQLARYRRAAPNLGNAFQTALASAGSDPLAAYRTMSALLAQQAQAHGYVDPRMYLHMALGT